jgi:hypothetical protein
MMHHNVSKTFSKTYKKNYCLPNGFTIKILDSIQEKKIKMHQNKTFAIKPNIQKSDYESISRESCILLIQEYNN